MPLDFSFIFLGQSVLRYRASKKIVDEINLIYENRRARKKMFHMRNNLLGKIHNEHSLFNASEKDEAKGYKHNFLSKDILNFFKQTIEHYLEWNRIKDYTSRINSVWVNEMKAGEYNPIHIHLGDIHTGLSSVMFLKIPKSYGKEWARSDYPLNGQLDFISNCTGQFCKIEYAPQNLKEGDFFLFPYDVRHLVYPFRGKAKRRTLAMNVDITYNTILSARA